MLTISMLEQQKIALSPAEQAKYAVMRETVTLPEKKFVAGVTTCHLCDRLLGVVWEYNILMLCYECAGKAAIAANYKRIRSLPTPPASSIDYVKKVEQDCLTMEQAEKLTVLNVMQLGLSKTDAAERLGITRATLYAKIRQHDIDWDK